MTDYSSNTAFDAVVTSPGSGPSDFALPAQNDGAEPIDAGVRAVRAVHAALSGHLLRPLTILSLGGDPYGHNSSFISYPMPAPAGQSGGNETSTDPQHAPTRTVARLSVQPDGIESFNAAVASGRYDLVLCAVPQDAGDGTDHKALLEAVTARADMVGAVVFETVWDGRAAENRDNVLPPDMQRLRGSFAFVHAVCEYGDDSGRQRRAILFCSNRYWYADGHADAFGSWTSYSNELIGESREGSRRYFFGTDKIAKCYCFYGSWAQENLRDIKLEGSFLSNPPIIGKSIPRFIAQHIGSRDGVLVMERLPGTLLTTAILQETDYDPASVLHDVLDYLCALERVGLYHTDIGIWNVLVNEDRSSVLIDFASINSAQHLPDLPYRQITRFLVFAQSVISMQLPSPGTDPFPIRPFAFPRRYRRWAAQFWTHPREERSFALLKTCLEAALNDRPLHRRRHGVIGSLLRSYRRFSYSRVLIDLQKCLFCEWVREGGFRVKLDEFRIKLGGLRLKAGCILGSMVRSFTARPITALPSAGRRYLRD